MHVHVHVDCACAARSVCVCVCVRACAASGGGGAGAAETDEASLVEGVDTVSKKSTTAPHALASTLIVVLDLGHALCCLWPRNAQFTR
jgi:hypothetical protein